MERERGGETAHAQHQLLYPEPNLLRGHEDNTSQIYRIVFLTLCLQLHIIDEKNDFLLYFQEVRRF